MQLTAQNLQAQRGGKILFADLSFCLSAGQILVLSGANGSGKSTLLRIIAGLYPQSAGHAELTEQEAVLAARQNREIKEEAVSARDANRDINKAAVLRGQQSGEAQAAAETDGAKAPNPPRRIILPRTLFSHYLSDKNAMKPQLSVFDNLRFWHRFFAAHGAPAAKSRKMRIAAENAAIEAALRRVKMTAYAELPFAALSTGQKRRVGLSRLSLVYRPLWLLDEPTSGLDSAGAALFADICRAHLSAGGLIAAATHLPLGLNADKTIRISDYKPKFPQSPFYDFPLFDSPPLPAAGDSPPPPAADGKAARKGAAA